MHKPNSVEDGHLSRIPVTWYLKQHYPGTERATPCVPLLALLQVGFTEPGQSPGLLVSSYLTFPPLPGISGRYLSVALALGSPPLDVIQHPALRSSDFPQAYFHMPATIW